jgi:predicted alpha/beta-fold hydrolase
VGENRALWEYYCNYHGHEGRCGSDKVPVTLSRQSMEMTVGIRCLSGAYAEDIITMTRLLDYEASMARHRQYIEIGQQGTRIHYWIRCALSTCRQ